MRSGRARCESDVYHVMARGVGQQIIFEGDADKARYLEKLKTIIPEEGGQLIAWCLMDNHVHVLVSCPMESLSRAMRRINSGYATYFNLIHGRCGHLFQGRFKSEPVGDDAYLMTVIRYIHQNPLKAGIVDGCSFSWNSYDEYLSGKLNPTSPDVLGIFGDLDRFIAFHEASGNEKGILDITDARKRLDDASALKVAKSLFGEELGNIKDGSKQERDEAIVSLKGAGLSVRQIQHMTGISPATISRA